MSLTKVRTRIYVRGLGTLMARESEPSSGSFYDIGYLQDANILDVYEKEEIHSDVGDLIQVIYGNRRAGAEANLLQVSKEEIDFLAGCADKVHAVRYCGLTQTNVYQYWCWEKSQIDPSIALAFATGKRVLPMKFVSRKQADLAYDVPLYYLVQLDREMKTEYLDLFLALYYGKNYQNTYALDYSGYSRHGAVSSAYATMWQLSGSLYFVRFDGTDDYVSLGDVLDDDATSDFMFEAWVKIVGADSGQEEILTKKEIISDNTAGYALYRTSANKIAFKMSSGSASVTVTSSSDVLQNTWTHAAVAVDRNGNATLYLNGAADGTPQSVASLGTGTNAFPLYLAREGRTSSTLYGQVDLGMIRHYTYGAGLLPSDIATIVSNHYNGEKAKFGL